MRHFRSAPVLRSGLMAATCLLAGCQTSQYAGSVTNFSTAVSSATVADQALAQAAIAARNEQIDQALANHPEAQVSVNTEKCDAASDYKIGDCTVTFDGMKMISSIDPATEGLARYAAALNAVINDKSGTTLATDVGNLGSAVQGLTATLGDTKAAAEAGPIATIIEQLGTLAIEARKIEILRTATAAADPVVEELAREIGKRDAGLTRFAIHQQVTDLSALRYQFNHNPKRQAADLAAMVALAAAIDKAQRIDPRAAMTKLAEVHHKLTEGLANPQVNWGMIQSNAQALVQTLQTVSTAAQALSKASTATTSVSRN